MKKLGDLTTEETRGWLAKTPTAILIPVGSCEPHGPHLPLDTDVCISETTCDFAVEKLAVSGITARIAPSIAYGVTDFAEGFAGAVSVPADVLAMLLRSIVQSFLHAGVSHVCLVNNHLEPAHDAAVRASIVGLVGASVASPLERRWARTLSAEFKSGACHAGRYETSLILAARVHAVRAKYTELPTLTESLSQGIAAGKASFVEIGMARAYTGAPAEASVAEGLELYEKLAKMVETEVLEGLFESSVASHH